MSILGNIVWIIFGGLISFIGCTIAGLLLCITVIGMPFGVQCFKIANFVLWPFGREVELGGLAVGGLIGNILWIIIFGWELAILHLLTGLFYCVIGKLCYFNKMCKTSHFMLRKLSIHEKFTLQNAT